MDGKIPKFSRWDEAKLSSLEDCLARYVPSDELSAIMLILNGRSTEPAIKLDEEIIRKAKEMDVDMKTTTFSGYPEELRPQRITRVALIQNSIVAPTTDPLEVQRSALHSHVGSIIELAWRAGANVVGLQEAWHMPFAFCTREKHPWSEFAEPADESGPSTAFLCKLAAKYNMVIVSPILERDTEHGDAIWNTAVIISNSGRVMGKSRKNHIPRVGDYNESTYYGESEIGHPVFETQFGRIAVNICYGRHHPLNWLMYGLNGAEIVFNPSATTTGLSEPLWAVEARAAAIANNYYTCAIDRVGDEVFPRSFTSGDNSEPHKDFGHFYGSSHICGPDGLKSVSLSRYQDGLLIGDLDLNACRQQKDWWNFPLTRRLALYGDLLTAAAKPDYAPQIIREK